MRDKRRWIGIALFLLVSPGIARSAELVPDMATKIGRLTNAYRKQNKKPPLSIQAELTQAAQQHALNMASQEQLSHELDGKNWEDRVRATGYEAQASGENVASATGKPDNAQAMVASWKKSKPHRANMLGEEQEFTQFGVGVAVSSSGMYYACQVFGIPKEAAAK